MFDIFDNNAIYLTQGNSASIEITPLNTISGDPYLLEDGDVMVFTVKNKTGQTVIQKFFTSADLPDEGSSIVCDIIPQDTESIPTGEYVYDVFIRFNDGDVVTFISSFFIISEAYGKRSDIVGTP